MGTPGDYPELLPQNVRAMRVEMAIADVAATILRPQPSTRCHSENRNALLQASFGVGGTGLEPVTPSLSSWSHGKDRRRPATTNALNHPGLGCRPPLEPAWLSELFLGRFGQE